MKLSGLSAEAAKSVAKHQVQDAVRHIAQPVFVDVKRKPLNPTYCYIRFSDKEQAETFLDKARHLDKACSPLHMLLGDKLALTLLSNQKDHSAYL